jgi:outer membrane protein
VKNLSLVLNIALFIAVVVLYVLHFSDRSSGIEEVNTVAAPGGPHESVSIAYINSDTLLQNYQYFKDMAAQLEVKRQKLETDFTTRAKGLENEFATFQRTGNSMTINQARAVEEDLMKKRDNLMKYQESLSQDLVKEETRINNELYNKVSEYLNDYGRKNNFQLVLTYQKGSGVLYANDSLNITQEVIRGLNDNYKQTGVKKDSVVTKK